MLFRILAVGDVVGNPGLDFAAKNLRRIKKEVGADFVVVNGENANVVGANCLFMEMNLFVVTGKKHKLTSTLFGIITSLI